MKAKLPGGPSTWPAFWMINDYCNNWDSRCTYGGVRAFENDILEQYNTAISYWHITQHLYNPHVIPYQQPYTKLPFDMSAGYHTYGVLWTATSLTYYADGVQYYTTPNPGMNGRAYMIVNLGMGPNGIQPGTKNPSDYDIAYVRAYQHN